MGILRLGYVDIRVTDLRAAVHYYRDVLGLQETARDGKVYFKAWDELEHHQVVLQESETAGLNLASFRVEHEDDLAEFERRLEDLDYRVERVAAGASRATGQALRFTAPSEHRIELYYDMELLGNGLSGVNPETVPDNLIGVHPPRLDHTLLTAPNAPESLAFWQDVMGFRLTEQVVDERGSPMAIWLTRGSSTHDLAFIPGKPGGMHHFAFWVDSWEEIGRAAETLARGGARLDAGPTRHGITRGHTLYFFDPSGNRNEVFTGGYWADPRMKPITWTADQLWTGIFYWDREPQGAFVETYT